MAGAAALADFLAKLEGLAAEAGKAFRAAADAAAVDKARIDLLRAIEMNIVERAELSADLISRLQLLKSQTIDRLLDAAGQALQNSENDRKKQPTN